MRIRSVLAATVLAVALAATGATTAGAHGRDDDKDDHEGACSAYFGRLTSLENTISWAGTHCRGSLH